MRGEPVGGVARYTRVHVPAAHVMLEIVSSESGLKKVSIQLRDKLAETRAEMAKLKKEIEAKKEATCIKDIGGGAAAALARVQRTMAKAPQRTGLTW